MAKKPRIKKMFINTDLAAHFLVDIDEILEATFGVTIQDIIKKYEENKPKSKFDLVEPIQKLYSESTDNQKRKFDREFIHLSKKYRNDQDLLKWIGKPKREEKAGYFATTISQKNIINDISQKNIIDNLSKKASSDGIIGILPNTFYNCLECHGTFVKFPTEHKKHFCCDACKQRAYRKRLLEGKVKRVCGICGIPITGKRAGTKTCSSLCRKKLSLKNREQK